MPKRHRLRRNDPLADGVVRVDRATMWGNPFRADKPHPAAKVAGARSAAEAFRMWLNGHHALVSVEPERRDRILSRMGELHGKDLACWCGPHDECHADVLMARAVESAPTIVTELSPRYDLPTLALSVRQPWAWAIIHADKDIENRSWQAVNHGLRQRGRIAIHAAKGMTKDEYWEAREFIDGLGYTCPGPTALFRGGIIGSVEVVDVVSASDSPWFFGPRGLVLRDPRPCRFVPAVGALGYFRWTEADRSIVPESAAWMLPKPPKLEKTIMATQPMPLPLFDEIRWKLEEPI